MTIPVLEIASLAALEATPLAGHLASRAAGLTLIPSFGTLTPSQLDASVAETRALISGAAVHDLGWLRRIAVRGEDRFRWLSGMVTNMVEGLPENGGAYNLVLNAQGRIQGDCTIWRQAETVELEIAVFQLPALMAHFDRFIIMDDVELLPLDSQSALGLTGPQAPALLTRLGVPQEAVSELFTSVPATIGEIPVLVRRGYGALAPHYELWTESTHIPALWQTLLQAGATPAGAAALESFRIAEGVPVYGIDIQSRDLAQETGQARAISFSKGCYLGQEIVERVRSRGQVHRHLRLLELIPGSSSEMPSPGTELRLQSDLPEAKAAAVITSAAAIETPSGLRSFALAMVRAEAEAGPQPLTWAGGQARILYSPPALT